MSNVQRTFVAIKPDAVQRGLIGPILSRFEQKGFKIVGLKLLQVPRTLAEAHYGEHAGKPFFKGLVAFITSGPVVAIALEGPNVVSVVRQMMGATNPKDALPGTIRGDFSVDIGRNIVHGSDSPESAQRELGLFFSEADLISGWSRTVESWVVEPQLASV
ncbi:MAG: nucleoside-diphosphate kinase [Vampirovibrionales bacterium]|nr:nucleoside-diphosphate kinase [Vampirovibrionales bacterium]